MLLSLFPQSGFTFGRLPLDSGLEITFSVIPFLDLCCPAGHLPGVSDPRVHPAAPASGHGDGDHRTPGVQQDHVHAGAECEWGPCSRPSHLPPGPASHSAEITSLRVLGHLMSELPRFSMCPLAWGPSHCLPGCSAELGLQGPVWLWAFVSGGQGEQGVQSEEGMCAQPSVTH